MEENNTTATEKPPAGTKPVTITLREAPKEKGKYQPELAGAGGGFKDSQGKIWITGTESDVTKSDAGVLTISYDDPNIESATLTVGGTPVPFAEKSVSYTFPIKPGQLETMTSFSLTVTLKADSATKGNKDWSVSGQVWSLDPYVVLKRKGFPGGFSGGRGRLQGKRI